MKKGTILLHNNNMGSSYSAVQKPERPSVTSPNKDGNIKFVGSGFSLKSSEFGSKDDTFFDSKAWLDSDCEDDFFSVNGDFTPSRGSTPIHPISILTEAKSDKSFDLDKFPDFKSGPSPSPSPTGRKKLGDLFQETQEQNASEEKQETNGERAFSFQTKSEDPPASVNLVGSGELTLSGELKKKKKAGSKTPQCCLPRFGQSLSFSERRQKTSPINCSA